MKPIIFSAPMVRAILDGSKKQTRRVVKPEQVHRDARTLNWANQNAEEIAHSFRCPYGVPGDLLWVKETFSAWHGGMTDCGEEWDEVEGPLSEWGPHSEVHGVPTIEYAADRKCSTTRWRPSIHMPRWASRITLRVVSVRVERLGEISESDMLAEGSPFTGSETSSAFGVDQRWFPALWDSRNKKHPWSSNPHVWVLDFERVEGGAA